MRLDVISDVHTEFMDKNDVKHLISKVFKDVSVGDSGDVLVLAGDIGDGSSSQYNLFINTLAKMYVYVIVVFGNHEYWYDLPDPSNFKENVIFLNRETIDVGPYIIAGCVLWTPIDEHEQRHVLAKLGDFRYIPNHTLEMREKLFRKDYTFLEKTLENSTKPVIVVTHMLPSYKCITKRYAKSSFHSAFACHADNLVARAYVWICGHSHDPSQTRVAGTLVINNSVGYKDEHNPMKLVSIEV